VSTPPTEKNVEFIAAEDYTVQAEQSLQVEYITPDLQQTLQVLSTPSTRLRVPRSADLSRKEVIHAFTDAFELIGGVPRLALWGHDNPTEFFKLYARLLPSQASSALGETTEMTIKHVLPRTALDQE